MDGSGPQRSKGGSGPPAGIMVAAFAILGVVLIAGAVTVGVRLAGDYSGDGVASGTITSMSATPVDLPDRSTRRSSTTTTSTAGTSSSVTRGSTATCDSREINADLGYRSTDARVISCDDGWAVMASAHSGDPFWVSYRGGRWRTVDDISMYRMTCPDEAISRGAPAWIAHRHSGTCPDLNPPASTRTSSDRPSPGPGPSPGQGPGASPGLLPTTSMVPTSSSSSSPPSSAAPTTGEMTTTTTPAASPAAVADGDDADEAGAE